MATCMSFAVLFFCFVSAWAVKPFEDDPAAKLFNYIQEGRDWVNFGICVRPGNQMQSPIDINPLAEWEVDTHADANSLTKPSLQICYRDFFVTSLVNTGRTIKGLVREGSYIQVGFTRYELKQFHFHTPSEHALYHQRYNMELNLVHTNADNSEIVVVAVLMAQLAKDDPRFHEAPDFMASDEQFWNLFKKIDAVGASIPVELTISIDSVMPAVPNRRYFFYEGSLTTPPCTENVLYFIAEDPVAVKNNLNIFMNLINFNARVLQSINGRKVFMGTPQYACPGTGTFQALLEESSTTSRVSQTTGTTANENENPVTLRGLVMETDQRRKSI